MKVIVCVFLFVLPAAQAFAAENIMLVLDASGSMWGQIAGKTKVEIARETVADVLGNWKADNAIGLVAYGHRRKGDCTDIETLIEPGPLDKTAFLSTVNSLNAKGMTPLSAAVQHAAGVLKSSEQKATVILVSDGEETCNLDPCTVGTALEKSGVDFTAHVIGFDVSDPQHQAQLRCLAENTGGRYFNARSADELGAAIEGAVSASTEPQPPPATASVAANGPLAITREVEISWSGPADHGDYVTFAPVGSKDGAYLDYVVVGKKEKTADKGVITLRAPAEAGKVELRYVSPIRKDSVLARVVLDVGDAEASIEAADSVPAGSKVKITARGPVGSAHWVGFAPKGSPITSYLNYARPTGVISEIELMPPAEPGEYELRYVLNERERIIASRPITVTASDVSVSGPATAMAGDTITIKASGPEGSGHWIGFAPAGSDVTQYRDYIRPQGAKTEGTLMAPTEAGDYELRYVLNEREKVVASQPIKVTAAVAKLDAPVSMATGEQITVKFAGPHHGSHWIGFVQRDTLDYLDYVSVPLEGDAVALRAPAEAGEYDLVFVIDKTAITRNPVTVR
ncbi:MAG TPA: VWA domain-containing protein [Dokdonella sp.]|uniref:VWA domain-containing protein n=1 Tax=Dokdonella sp. TaxID=2291710 RepID=UPI002D80768D|nr:VWA domain-containing protein [Dokdonella sp.]HET9032134.1 VWA domain-containing protein [Dokdonella sp.]